jgi:two-component sensor histidine kinase
VVSDDGIGIPEDLDFRNTESLGLQLVTSLVEGQLQGKTELNRAKGTEFRIRFIA